MSTEILAGIITVALTMLGGVIGYLIKEYRDRLRPMISVTDIQVLTKKADPVNVPDEIVEATQKSFSIRELKSSENVDAVRTAYEDVKDLIQYSDQFLETIEKVIASALKNDAIELSNNLAKCLNKVINDRWLRILLGNDHVIPKPSKNDLPIVVSTFYSQGDNGCVLFDFPSASTPFGMNFDKEPLLKDKCMKFVHIVERLDYDAIRIFFESVKQKILNEKMIAKSIQSTLLKLDNQNGRWEFQLFVANLGSTPFLVHPKGFAEVKDAAGAYYAEECYLVLRKYDEKGDLSRVDARTPFIVRGESDAEISFITTKTQGDMDHGDMIRALYNSKAKSAKVSIKFNIEKSGFKRFMSAQSPSTEFMPRENE